MMAPLAGVEIGDPQPFKLRFEHYEMLDLAGSFLGRRVELIEGTLIEMSPQRRPHSYAKNELTFRLRLALAEIGSPLVAQSEVTLPLRPHSGPEPDIALTDAPRGQGYIPVESVALIVEIADTSLHLDITAKKDLYAGAGILEYWVVDVAASTVRQFWSVGEGAYAQSHTRPLDGPISSATIPDLIIDGSGIL